MKLEKSIRPTTVARPKAFLDFAPSQANKMVGTLPLNFTRLQNLSQMNLNGNKFTGSLNILAASTKLRMLDVGGNQFTSSLPPAFSGAANRVLGFSNDEFFNNEFSNNELSSVLMIVHSPLVVL